MANSQVGILLGDYLMANIAQEYGWNYVPPNRPHPQALTELLIIGRLRSTEAAIQRYWELKQADSPQRMVDKNTLLYLGYALLFEKKVKDAIEVMKLCVQENPKYWNAYDSLAELYLHSGDKERAIENYGKSIELNPDNQNGIRMLRKLKEQD